MAPSSGVRLTIDARPTWPRCVRHAVVLLRARFAEPLSIDELASAVGSNRWQLTRELKRAIGLAPHEYLIKLRIERACELLARGFTATEVAHAVGFHDQSHFTRHFKSTMNITPGKYAAAIASL